jgi:hypothetical protein
MTFGQTALTLHDGGWRPLPAHGKAAFLLGWAELSNIPWDRDALLDATARYADANCGIVADRNHVILDFDVLIPHLAGEIAGIADLIFGPTPLIRVGRAPKQVRIYCNGSHGQIRSSKPHPIEIMCGSGMVIGFGVHPNTQRPYQWISAHSPLTLPADSTDIPTIDAGQLQRFLAAASKLLAPVHYLGSDRAGRAQPGDRSRFTDLRQRIRTDAIRLGFERAAIRLLREASEGNRHVTAFEVIAAAAGRGWSEARIVRLFAANFAGWDGLSDDAFERILDTCFRKER